MTISSSGSITHRSKREDHGQMQSQQSKENFRAGAIYFLFLSGALANTVTLILALWPCDSDALNLCMRTGAQCAVAKAQLSSFFCCDCYWLLQRAVADSSHFTSHLSPSAHYQRQCRRTPPRCSSRAHRNSRRFHERPRTPRRSPRPRGRARHTSARRRGR